MKASTVASVLSSTGLTYSLTDMDLVFTERKEELPTDSAALSPSLLSGKKKKNTEEHDDERATETIFHGLLSAHSIF